MRKWNDLPLYMQNNAVKEYYDILSHKKVALFFKRFFDIMAASIMLLILLPFILIIAILIKLDSSGPVFFRQIRVTRYGRKFGIFKFRTMVDHAEKMGSQVSIHSDPRITKVGGVLRKIRLDEIPQLINILTGDMSFVGTRPEVVKYVDEYTPEMYATLLMPAGVTSEASIRYKDEAALLTQAENVDDTYIKVVLPQKMQYNLLDIKKFSFFHDIGIMFRTVFAVIR